MAGDTIKETLMKRLLILLLLLPSLAWGQEYARMSPIMLGGGVAAAAPSTFCKDNNSTQSTDGTLCEDFDNPSSNDCYTGASDDNCYYTWYVANSYDFTGATNIGGTGSTYSLDLKGKTGEATSTAKYNYSETANATYWVYFKIKLADVTCVPTGNAIFIRLRSGGDASNIGEVGIYNDSGTYKLSVTNIGGGHGYSSGGMTLGETYNIWIMVDPGSSNDTKIHAAFSTGTTRPNDGDAGYAKQETGQNYAALDTITLMADYGSSNVCGDYVIDNVFIGAANTEITGVP
jgi:hypothetical protein